MTALLHVRLVQRTPGRDPDAHEGPAEIRKQVPTEARSLAAEAMGVPTEAVANPNSRETRLYRAPQETHMDAIKLLFHAKANPPMAGINGRDRLWTRWRQPGSWTWHTS